MDGIPQYTAPRSAHGHSLTERMPTSSEKLPVYRQVELSIVMPCLNEAETLATCIAAAQRALVQHDIVGEVIVADNGSTDGSQQIAEQLGARVVSVEAKGYGHALMGGIAAACGTFVIVGDSDASYDFFEIDRFLDRLRLGADLVVGNRFLGGIKPGAMPWKNRYLGNPALSGIGRLLFRSPVGDFHCGIRGFSKHAYETLDLRTGGMEFASEMIIKATLKGLRIEEVPASLSPDGRNRPSHLRAWRDGWRHLRFMLLYSPRWLFLYPGAVLMLAGVVAGTALFRGPVSVGSVTFDIHTMLFAAISILVGFQSVSFAVLSKAFGIQLGLLPEDRAFRRFIDRWTLEVGLAAGAALILAGLAVSLMAVWYWRNQSFGSLLPTQVLRWVIPGATCLTLGSQVVMVSLFLGTFGLRLKR